MNLFFESKAFDSLNCNLLLVNLNVNGFSFIEIRFIQSYFLERFQRVNINNHFSEWCKILLRVPQGSILGLLLFNIFITGISYYNMLKSATLLIIIHYIQLKIISKKLKLILRSTLNSCMCGFMKITWCYIPENATA